MSIRRRRLVDLAPAHVVVVVLGLAVATSGAACGGDPLATLDPELEKIRPSYERDVRPVLQRHCVICHASGGVPLGGVELDSYETAWGNRVRNACTSIIPALVERYRDHLQPTPRDPSEVQQTCGVWEMYSMPTDAQPRPTLAEQLILVRWVATGAAR